MSDQMNIQLKADDKGPAQDQGADEKISKILIPLDGTEFSRSCLKKAQTTAERNDAQVFVVGCVDLHDLIGPGVDASPLSLMSKFEANKTRLAEQLREVVEELEDVGLVASSRLVTGSPLREIVSTANQEGIDLIIMASHGRRGFRRWLLGSVTETVIRHSTCPVMVVNNPEDAETKSLFERFRSYLWPSYSLDDSVPLTQ